MSIKVMSDQEVLQEAARVLLEHLSPEKVARFWAIWQLGEGNYLTIREQLFADETVETLYKKILAYQQTPEQDSST